ncbi:VIT domain-containing protein [Humisphaera borealis]|uniref:VWA domain-containing protein n=1 Tax=Humisphaera borealis TaxID=2807512 RepID=A0A7M2WTS0_9BACT|nr:VIT domain-containing protein [Humisphaera borealis]QOV88908.1 VWA domain-containing protein [Humisphaera borealis]
MKLRMKQSRWTRWSVVTLCLIVVPLLGVAVAMSGCGNSESYTGQRLHAEQSREARLQAMAPNMSVPTAGQPTGPSPRRSDSILLPNDDRSRAISDLVPPSSLPAPGEELWVIEKRDIVPAAAGDDLLPRSGALMAKLAPDAPPQEFRPCPLKHTDVKAQIAGYIAAVDVTQQFHNPFGVKIEAVYVFPLPANAAVNEFVMTVGDRKIRGVIREKEQARQIYENARAQGFTAALMVQDRPNVFTQSVANIEPGRQIDINIRYFNTLTYADGWYELAFPTVVGPRFNPPHIRDGIGAVGPGARGTSGQNSEVTYLRPETRTGHDIAIAVDLDAGVNYEELASVNHAVQVQRHDGRRATIALSPHDTLPNKDFVLRWRVAGDKVKTGLIAAIGDDAAIAGNLTRSDGVGRLPSGHFAMMIVPPATLKDLPVQPLEFVFTIDVSGSMSGRPMEQARSAMLHALKRLGPNDRFQVVKFFNEAEQMAPQPVPATPDNINAAMAYVNRMSAGGGTMMLEGMRKSLDFPRDLERTRVVCFLTDGFIGNEGEILGAMHQWIGDARVFSFGVGQSTNRYLLDHMAKMGRGAAAYISLNDNADTAMAAFFDRVRHPAMTDIAVDFGTMNAREIYPRQPGDLLVGRPIILTGKFDGALPAKVLVSGRMNGRTQSVSVPVTAATGLTARALPPIWARGKIADLADEATWRPSFDLPQQIKQVALEYSLMSSFTSFVAVDSSRRTEGKVGISTPVPVPVPDGVWYDTTVGEGAQPPTARRD